MKIKKALWAPIALSLSLVFGSVMAQVARTSPDEQPPASAGTSSKIKTGGGHPSAGTKKIPPPAPEAPAAGNKKPSPSSGVGKINLAEAKDLVILGFDGRYQSNYVTPNGVAYGDPIYRLTLTASFKYDIVAGVTKIGSFGNGNSPYSEEYRAFVEKTWRPISDEWFVTAGFEYQFIRGPWDLGIPYGEIGRNWEVGDASKLTAYSRAEHWWNPEGTTTDNGTIVTVGLRLLTRVSGKFRVSVGAAAIYDPGVQGGVEALNGKLETRVYYDLTESTTLYGGGDYYLANTYGGTSRIKNEGVFEIGVKVNDLHKQFKGAVDFFKGRDD
jgi:hypothetical protein